MRLGKGKEIAWGILLLAAAALLILSQAGFEIFVGEFTWFQVIVLIGCVWAMVTGLFEMEFFKMTLGAALGYVIADGPMGWPAIDGWVVFVAAIIVAMGLHKIFHRGKGIKFYIHRNKRGDVHMEAEDDYEDVEYREVDDEDAPRQSYSYSKHYGKEQDVVFHSKTVYSAESETISGDYVFSNITQYIEGNSFRGIYGDTVFSSVRIYFDKAKLCNNNAEVCGDTVFSTKIIYVPKEWNVVDDTGRIFSNHRSNHAYREGQPTVRIVGDCVFSSVVVKRI